jgi:hypothetical protein
MGRPGGPGAPVLPREPFVESADVKPDTPIVLLSTTQPVAILSSQISAGPANVHAGEIPLLIFRDVMSGEVRAFDRHVEADLIPQFVLNRDLKRKGLFRDVDTNTCWSASGIAVDGEKERLGHKLAQVDAQEHVYWGVAKYWWPNLELVKAQAEPVVASVTASTPTRSQPPPARRQRRTR